MSGPPVPAPPAWWRAPGVLERYLTDLLQTEMAALRPQGWPLPVGPATPAHGAHLHWVDDLGADSLELLTLSSALAEAVAPVDAAAAQALHGQARLGAWFAVAREALEAGGGERIGFRTSGSTGRPRRCEHRLADLWTEVAALAPVLGPAQRVVGAVRSHHIYGFLFTVLLPQWPGPAARPVLDMAGQSPAVLSAVLQAGDLVVGFPDWWQAVARLAPSWPAGVVGLTSTAPCPEAVSQDLLAGGLPRLVHLYGSSETAGIGWREGVDAHYELLPHWRRRSSEDDAPLERLRADQPPQAVSLPDRLRWLDARRFVPGPRQDGAVQVGGINVYPSEVRRRLLGHPALADVAVRLHEDGGVPRLKAFVVPRKPADAAEGAIALRAELQAWMRRHLAPAARPVHISIGTALPVNAMGKASDWPVSAPRADRA